LSFESSKADALSGMWVRLAEGSKLVADGKNTWTVDDKYQVTVSEALASTVKLRESGGKQELILPVPVPANSEPSEFEYYVRW